MMSLNSQQKRAVLHRGSDLLVLAGAGTGKTRVITQRIDRLIAEGTSPKRILAVTFTNKAAKEMRERLRVLGVPDGVWVGTFHSIGMRILRSYAEELGYQKNFTLYGDDAQIDIVKVILADTDLGGLEIPPRLAMNYISGLKTAGKSWDDMGDSDVPAKLHRHISKVFRKYQASLKHANAMDFTDLLGNTVLLLRKHSNDPGFWLNSRFSQVLVDEFQDTNPMQMEMVDLLSQQGETCAVGDDDQCQPPGALVSTPGGKTPIERLQPQDEVLSASNNREGGGLGLGTEKVLSVGSSPYSGPMHTLSLEGGYSIRSTPNHKFYAMWDIKEAQETWFVFLEKDKNGLRLALRGFDEVFTGHQAERRRWALGIGSSLAIVRNMLARYTRDLDDCPRRTDDKEKAKHILAYWGFEYSLPFDIEEGAEGSLLGFFQCYAANIIPGVMQIPAAGVGGDVHPEKVNKNTQEWYEGRVHSLSVGGSKTYVSDDVITHNSIYGWRGADPHGMSRFYQKPNTELIKLEENYRCTKDILACANAVIANNGGRIGKQLRPNKEGPPVRITRTKDERDEAACLARTINRDRRYERYAVLYRTHSQSRAIEESFRLSAIPYTIIGGLRFYDRSEVKDILSYFSLAINLRSDIDILRVANRPARGVGAKKLAALQRRAQMENINLVEAISKSEDLAVKNLNDILMKVHAARDESEGICDFFRNVMKITGYRESLLKKIKTSSSKVQVEKAKSQLGNIDEMAADCASFQDRSPHASVDEYLQHVSLLSSVDKDPGRAVPLMTIHAAKGLEFPHVFLVGFENDILPHANSTKRDVLGGLQDPSQVEEERRLCYVAMTRAQESLDISFAVRRKVGEGWKKQEPSIFLREVPTKAYIKVGF